MTIAGAGLSTRLAAVGCATLTILAAASVSACSGSPPPPVTLSPGATGSLSPTILPSDTASRAGPSASGSPSASLSATPRPSATPGRSATPGPSASKVPSAAPATGGGGTAGFSGDLLLVLGGMAILAGAGSVAYRRKIIRNR